MVVMDPDCTRAIWEFWLEFAEEKSKVRFPFYPIYIRLHYNGPKPYGFVGYITTVVATVVFFVWAYVPETWLNSIGIFYYPSRYWALAVPVYVMVTVALALGFYLGLNFMSTPSPTSLNIMFDEFSREPLSFVSSVDGDEPPIEPISDIGINKINDLMFNNVTDNPHQGQTTMQGVGGVKLGAWRPEGLLISSFFEVGL
ncbi:Phosphatidylinositol N-acetylglucosaminyltransferase subunit P [Morella rubra]|uniref:Phosphatidylinositol N-acetylglucosaminyltransferase subunit P n=1 Tax=Morella rubra TaxID=262757 RepID=A0A6A1WMG7_9ROSI|nr:Phosphatidylinositol N-acetylglucosaminyltransferase subunit P [Morella rubra]